MVIMMRRFKRILVYIFFLICIKYTKCIFVIKLKLKLNSFCEIVRYVLIYMYISTYIFFCSVSFHLLCIFFLYNIILVNINTYFNSKNIEYNFLSIYYSHFVFTIKSLIIKPNLEIFN